MMINMEERLNSLESVMAELAHAQARTEIALKDLAIRDEEARRSAMDLHVKFTAHIERMDATNARIDTLCERLDSTATRTDAFGAELRVYTARVDALTEQLQVYTERMDGTRETLESDMRQMKKAWGDLANKLGTVAEDIVAPNIPRLARDEFGKPVIEDLVVRPAAR